MSDLTEFARHRYTVDIGGADILAVLGDDVLRDDGIPQFKVEEIEVEFEGHRSHSQTGWTLAHVILTGPRVTGLRAGLLGFRGRMEYAHYVHVHEMPTALRTLVADLAARLPAALPNVYDLSL